MGEERIVFYSLRSFGLCFFSAYERGFHSSEKNKAFPAHGRERLKPAGVEDGNLTYSSEHGYLLKNQS